MKTVAMDMNRNYIRFVFAAGNFVSRENNKISFRNERYYAYFSWNYSDTFCPIGGDFDFSAGASDSSITWLIERKENKPRGYAFFLMFC